MVAKIKPQAKPNQPITIGIDIGYGYVKAVSSITPTPIIFPSVWGMAREIKFKADEIAKKYSGDQLSDDEGAWFVGNLALSQLPARNQRKLRGRTKNESELGHVARLRLFMAALGKMFTGNTSGDVIHVRIATGLPVDHMRNSQELKDTLIGQHVINTDSAYFIANVTEVMVMPQPYGTIYRQMLTHEGQVNACHTFKRTGVCDLGTYTIDVTLDDDGEYIDDSSGSLEAGVHTIQSIVALAYERDFQEKPDLKQIETIIRTRCINVFGEPKDYSYEVSRGTVQLKEATLNLMQEKWGIGSNVDVIYVAGGGAYLVFNDIKQVYPQSQMVTDAQVSNAQGYLNYALFSAEA